MWSLILSTGGTIMNTISDTATKMETTMSNQEPKFEKMELFQKLFPAFADRAAGHDEVGSFVQNNYDDLKAEKLFSVAIPVELGGGGMTYSQLSHVIREMAKVCGSTALSYVMHSHPVLLNHYKHLNMNDEKAKATLTKIAANELVIAGTGANDWLQSNGKAVPTEGGYIVNAHKRFVSGGPGAQVFVTSAVEESETGDQVLHFSIPFATPGIEIQSNWNTMGMRGTGSNDVLMKNVFVPEEAIVVKRPAGEWHPMWDLIIPIAIPLIVSCYMGLAEKAVEIAISSCKGKLEKAAEIGEMKNHIRTAQMATDAMVRNCEDLQFNPDIVKTEAIFSYKAIATKAIHAAVNTAANLVGGPGYFKGNEIERIMRDVRALHFHPLPELKQLQMSGRLTLDMTPF